MHEEGGSMETPYGPKTVRDWQKEGPKTAINMVEVMLRSAIAHNIQNKETQQETNEEKRK